MVGLEGNSCAYLFCYQLHVSITEGLFLGCMPRQGGSDPSNIFSPKIVISLGLCSGACPGVLKGGGGSNISWSCFPKKGHQILKEGGPTVCSGGGGVQDISLPLTSNLAYLDAKGIFKLKLPSQAQG